jgi:hypothetical protein
MVRYLPSSRPKPRTDLIKHALPLAFWLWIHEAGDYGGYSKQMVRRVRSRSFGNHVADSDLPSSCSYFST